MNGESNDRAKYHAMVDASAEDWQIIVKHAAPFQKDLPNRIVTHLNLLKGDCGGYPVDRLEHSLQTATRAHQAGDDAFRPGYALAGRRRQIIDSGSCFRIHRCFDCGHIAGSNSRLLIARLNRTDNAIHCSGNPAAGADVR